MKKSRILLPILLILAIGCAQVEKETADWHTGYKALEMNFVEGAPPKVVYNDDTITGMLELWNRGTWEITGGNIYFTGFDKGIITNIPEPIDFAIAEKKAQYNPEGGYITKQADNVKIVYDFPTGVLNTKVRATAVYPYFTEFSTDVCVDPNPYTPGDKVCTMETKTISNGQGAPVAITNIEPQSLKNQVRFKISFRNAGNGDVLAFNKIDTKPSELKPNDYDYVEVPPTSPKLGGQTGSCQPATVKLVNGQGFTFCTFSVTGGEAYITRLDLKLGYGYMNSVETSVEVRGSPTN